MDRQDRGPNDWNPPAVWRRPTPDGSGEFSVFQKEPRERGKKPEGAFHEIKEGRRTVDVKEEVLESPVEDVAFAGRVVQEYRQIVEHPTRGERADKEAHWQNSVTRMMRHATKNQWGKLEQRLRRSVEDLPPPLRRHAQQEVQARLIGAWAASETIAAYEAHQPTEEGREVHVLMNDALDAGGASDLVVLHYDAIQQRLLALDLVQVKAGRESEEDIA